MRKRAYIINSTVILLIIPLMLLLATYEDVSSQIIFAQSERMQVERTYRVVSYVELDLQRALEISGKRALVTVVDYIASTGDFLDPQDSPANVTIRDLVLFKEASGISQSYVDKIMKDQTLKKWLINVSTELKKQGYTMEISNTPLTDLQTMSDRELRDFLINNVDITVAPLDSFRIVIRTRLKNVKIYDTANNVVYEGSIPRQGYVYSIISIQDLEDPMFSALTNGRYFRSIQPCNYTYPELIDRPVKVLYGNGNSDRDHVAGIYKSSPDLDYIFFGSTYPNADAHAYVLKSGSPPDDTPFLNGTVFQPGGDLVDPTSVIKNDDFGVLVFGDTSSSNWCDASYRWRVNITIPQTPWGSLVLLKVPTSMFPGIYSTEDNASLVIYSGDGSCNQVDFWIEYWGSTYAWIWIKSTGTSYSIYFTDDPNKATSGYNAGQMFWLIDTFDGSAGSSPNPGLWENPGGAYLDGNGNLVVPAGVEKLVLQTLDALTGNFFVRFRMAPERAVRDFDAGVQVASSTDSREGYLQVTVNYPSNVQDVQIPVYLDSTTAQMILHNDLSQAQIEVYSDPQMTSPLPFWIEYWNDNGALIWIRGDLPGTFYIKYNTGTYRRGDGDAVFPFFDDFNETLSKWTIDPYDQGAKASIDTTGNGTVTIDGGNSVFAMRNKQPLNIRYDFGVRFRMKPNFQKNKDWDAGIGLWDGWIRYVGEDWDGEYYIAEQLFTDDIPQDDPMAIHWAEWGYDGTWWIESWWYDNDDLDSGQVSNRDYEYHTYEVREVYNTSASFTDFTRGITNNYGETYKTLYSYLNYIFLVIDSENKNRGATYDWIFVRKLIDDDELSYDITNHPITYDLQFIDDTSATNEDHGGDFLGILQNWGDSVVSTPIAPVYSSYVYRYEVNFTPSNGNVELSFARISSTDSIDRVGTSVSGYPTDNIKIGIVIDNQNNNAYFDWIIIGLGSYQSVKPAQIISSSVETAPETTATYTARAYNLQPFLECVMDMRYFGTYSGWSFFERLENSDDNHASYFRLAMEMQDELGIKYGDEYYPIGLVSFMVPYRTYDEKLYNLFANLQKNPEEGVSSVDYNFLNYYFNGGTSITGQGYRIWGISYAYPDDMNTVLGNPLEVPFFMDYETATAIFGAEGANDLLKR
ncbi:DUF2341 domain-containing protein [Thermococcus sp. GR7]|uniref:DUF2341 domain-containing protein n=1 Tax=unclassified Thermococcus TaxID=2627626 RepID=UPI001431C015|nr:MULTISPECIES: DUF2341 domain-containing protein [unclassified Thermococcus]NJE45871.1 DUF2341 domain-containing protein [Thermococcus sp. GR7]NJE78761.1 DUF2341 domain-containing protein [Thermococcus sp. GR4]NJF22065.1 DUF2341 domain-containing protein [Thermococcus sp. GR5]